MFEGINGHVRRQACASFALRLVIPGQLALVAVSVCLLSSASWAQTGGLPLDLPDEGVTIPSEYELTNFRNPLFRPISFGMRPHMKVGEGNIQLPSLGLSLVALDDLLKAAVTTKFLERGQKPEDAILKLGMFYLDAESVTAAVLFSDNVHATNKNRQAGVISIISVDNIQAILALGENTRVSVDGDFIILPFEGKMGLNGFGARRDLVGIALRGDVSAAQGAMGIGGFNGAITHDMKVAGWDVLLADRFGVDDFDRYETFDTFLGDKLLTSEGVGVEPLVFDEEDVAGEYSYGPGGRGMGHRGAGDYAGSDWWGWDRSWRPEEERREYADRDDEERNLELFNTISATARREAPAQLRPEISVFRTQNDTVYSEDPDEEDQADWREGAIVSLAVDRPSMRFPPYFSYSVTRDSDDPEWERVLRLGIGGPTEVTRNMHFYGNVGYASGPKSEEEEWLYEFHVRHQPRRTTVHGLSATRYFSEPEDELRTEVQYLLNQILGPYLRASVVGGWSRDEENDDGEEEWGAGGGLFFVSASKKLSLGIRELYVDESEAPDGGRWETYFDARYRLNEHVQFTYHYSRDEDEEWDSIASVNYGISLWRNEVDGDLRLDYRFIWRDSNEERDTYWENLVVLSYKRPI